MKYQIEDNAVLFEVDRRQIADITPGDVLETEHFPGGAYTWTEQDSQFIESNPEANVYLRMERHGDAYEGKGILILPAEVNW
ncbi:hypothetical protein [Pseudochryseolinea flava]|uniref:Uncharacterized protein n=1 Tax=Pseudochryseolinea flava TaxID=2059302 RepID=A0A364Y0A8_9BACT|nr:hypothetical protein [Pseudochryseolinea flava]RAW00099.1 hypothetical protein DQQ10_16245 [Pseudochryseolinea flava]